ncbi:MAG TPA: hypothetical protein VFJ90_01215, partial [Candidatus Didemnitutus sp.]|nr:hypothetical protein [Candidatus Didemnitutus sp.]
MQRRRPSRHYLILALLGVAPALAAGKGTPAAEVQVSGLGWWGNREARQTLARLNDSPNRPVLDANTIEDASLILFSELTEKGYLSATMTAEVAQADGAKASYPLDARLEHSLPRPLEARAVTLEVKRGPQFFLSAVKFEGLHALREKDA